MADTQYAVVNLDTRQIDIPSEYKIAGVFNDSNMNTIWFKVPRYYHGTDLSTFTIQINYENANEEVGIDVIASSLITISDEYFIFPWTLGRGVFGKEGKTTFVICMTNQYDEFNTTVESLTILEGLEVTINPSDQKEVKNFVETLKNYFDTNAAEKTAEFDTHVEQIQKDISTIKAKLDTLNLSTLAEAKEYLGLS